MRRRPQTNLFFRKLFFSAATILAVVTAFATPTNRQATQSTTTTCAATMTGGTTSLRSVKKVLPRPFSHWVGDGFKVYPVFANAAFTNELSPLLMFDYAEPRKFPVNHGKPLGVGQHPHRGFETVTIAFQGEVEHHDSTGKSGVIKPGDVQWMTAGRGIIHEEYHSNDFSKTGGTFEMCQLWVNLPKKHKMTKPRYQPISSKDIPTVNLPFGADASESVATARIIAGELGEIKGTAKTFSPVQMWDVSLPKAGTEVDLPFPSHHNCVVFVRRGKVQVVDGNKANDLGPQDVAVMNMNDNGGDNVRIRVKENDSSVMILGGEPIDEPIANHGPFVMNTQAEISQAIADFRMGKFGQ